MRVTPGSESYIKVRPSVKGTFGVGCVCVVFGHGIGVWGAVHFSVLFLKGTEESMLKNVLKCANV